MNARDKILQAVKAGKPAPVPLPEIDLAAVIRYPDLSEQFKQVLSSIGGQCVEAGDIDMARRLVQPLVADGEIIDTTLSYPGDLATRDAVTLASVDTAIIRGSIAVAENGAIWVTEKEMVNRLLPFIAQQLILIVEEKDIVATMHHAYEKISINATGFGAFIAGPSKTADIEQSLVIGAHGPCGMKAVILK